MSFEREMLTRKNKLIYMYTICNITSDCILYNEIVVTGVLNITGVPDTQGNLPKIMGGRSNRLFKVESGGTLMVKDINITIADINLVGSGVACFYNASSGGTDCYKLPGPPQSARVRIIDDDTLEVTVQPPVDDGGSASIRQNGVNQPP